MNAKDYLYSAVLAIGVALSATSFAQAPAGATGECKDGSYSKSDSKRGACGKHGGVKEWYEKDRPTEKAAATPGIPSRSAASKALSVSAPWKTTDGSWPSSATPPGWIG